MADAGLMAEGYPLRAVAARALAFWLGALLVLGAAFWTLDRRQHAAIQRTLGIQQRTLIEQASGTLAAALQLPLADLPYLADRPAVHRWLAGGETLAGVATDLLTLARHRPDYVKLRLFDAGGRELVRVNQTPDGPHLVPESELQDKAERYFVRDGLEQPSGTIHVSRFDLNVERGEIERPFRPMLRFGLPVRAADGAERGLITINYSGNALLDQLAQLAMPEADIGVWLVDGEGHWLLGERPEEAWAFEFAASGEAARFADRHGPAWALLQGAGPGATGQAEIGGDLFAWRRVLPAAVGDHWRLSGPGTKGWLLISRTPRQAVAAAAAGQHLSLLGGFAALALAVLPGALALAHFQIGRRQNLNRLRASEARFRDMLAAAPDAILILDEGGRIRLSNARGEEWFGYRNEELVGRSAEVLVPERLRERYRALWEEHCSAPRVRLLGADAGLAGRRRDGCEFAVELSLAPLINHEGVQVIAVVRDVTEKHALEQAREEAQTRYRQLFANLPLGVFRSSLSERLADDRRFLEVNPALVALFEAGSAERLLACPPVQLYADDQQRAALVAELFALGAVTGRELRMVTLSGRVFDARLSLVTRRDDDGNRFVDGVIEDISARCAAERDRDRAAEEVRHKAAALETANRELESFSYSVSHDLRAPLRAVDGFSRILEQGYGERLDDSGREYLGRVRRAAQHMAALIDDLLRLARVARSELQPGPVDLSGLATELAATLDEREPGRELRWHIEPGLVARGDARLLRVALDNLFDNAWKFTRGRQPGEVCFGSHVRGQAMVYYVRDNGVGFDMAYADKLFGAFQRLHDPAEFPGTGVGLATVQRVVGKHGGLVWAEAEVGKGAAFYFTLGMQEAA